MQLDERAVGIRPQRIDLGIMLKEIRASLEDEATAQEITVVVDSQCPPVGRPQHTRAILSNLLSNAIKFSPSGSTVWLNAHMSQDERIGVVEIKDQGFGIEQNDLTRLFKFTRLDTGSTKTRGHGLGLAVSQRLAELMHGSIEVSSTLGRGSVFALKLPLAEGLSPNKLGTNRSSEPPVMLPPLRVVHIEDNPLNRSLVEAMFSAYPQVRLHSAETAAEGQAAIESMNPDVALVDINLPDGSGLDLCRRIRAQSQFRHLPMIALSADALPEHIAKALQNRLQPLPGQALADHALIDHLVDLADHAAAPPHA